MLNFYNFEITITFFFLLFKNISGKQIYCVNMNLTLYVLFSCLMRWKCIIDNKNVTIWTIYIYLDLQDWSDIDNEIFGGATSEVFRQSLHCDECLTAEHVKTKCPYRKSNTNNGRPSLTANTRQDGATSPRRMDCIEQALANPEKSARRPSEGLQLKFAFGWVVIKILNYHTVHFCIQIHQARYKVIQENNTFCFFKWCSNK